MESIPTEIPSEEVPEEVFKAEDGEEVDPEDFMCFGEYESGDAECESCPGKSKCKVVKAEG